MRVVMPSSVSLPFDCHNHIQLGILRRELLSPSPDRTDLSRDPLDFLKECQCSGMAIMATHPRDYSMIEYLSSSSHLGAPITVVPCFGIHPWFISELDPQDWEMRIVDSNARAEPEEQRPQWWFNLRQRLIDHPDAMIGELGLDRFHYTTITNEVDGTTKQYLSTPIEAQVQVLEYQLELAIEYQRPISIHCVHAFGMLLDSLRKFRQRYNRLPPKIYFHAFSGQLGTIPQILSLCEPKSKKLKNGDRTICCYFGFAPVVNFRSPKTPAIIRAIGLERIVLETDVEETEEVASHLDAGLAYIAEALGVDQAVVLEQTTRNSRQLYNLTTASTL